MATISSSPPSSSDAQPAGAWSRRSVAYGAAVAALVFWGGQAVIAKGVALDPLPMVFYRIWIAVVWSLVVLYLSGGRLSRLLLRRCVVGGVAFGLDLVLFFTALKLTTVANTTVIASLQPVLLVFAAPVLFKERVRLHEVLLAGLAIVGVGLVVFGASGLPEWSARGDVWAISVRWSSRPGPR
jgi:drug/metabolite transporter (DMT)-like permease